jgi:hypothetical protein
MNELEHITDRDKLVRFISDLVNHDFPRLVQLLYRVDINEQKLKQVLKENSDTDAAELITDLVISRQKQKKLSREENRDNKDISDEERW